MRGGTIATIFAAAVGCFVVYLVTTTIFSREGDRALFGASTAALSGEHVYNGNTETYYGAKRLANFATGNNNEAKKAAPNAGESNVNYQGLPAKIEIPAGARSTWFQTELLPTDQPRGVRVVLLSAWIADWAQALLALIALGLIVREFRTIRDGVRELWPAPAAHETAPAT